MPRGLERRYKTVSSHFITCSCYHRLPYRSDDCIKRTFLCILEEVRREYRFRVYGYVLMPEHFHLLMSKPEVGDPSVVFQVLKQRVARQGLKNLTRTVSSLTLSQKTGKDGAPAVTAYDSSKRQFWQRRFYDFNVCTREKHVEKLRYMHRNPVKRGLAKEPGDWRWSSFRHYTYREMGVTRWVLSLILVFGSLTTAIPQSLTATTPAQAPSEEAATEQLQKAVQNPCRRPHQRSSAKQCKFRRGPMAARRMC